MERGEKYHLMAYLPLWVLFLFIGIGCGSGDMFPIRPSTLSGTDSATDLDSDSGTETEESSDTGTDTLAQCDGDFTLVESLGELLPLLKEDDVNVQLAAGTYSITPDDVLSGLFSDPTLLNITASNSTYCFAGVRLEIETEVFQSFGNVEVIELGLLGTNTVVQHLTIEDIGDTRPASSAVGVMIDGSGNRVEGLHLTVRGSEPYGYGNMFGDDAENAIPEFRHTAISIRGDDQHLIDCTVIHHAYGHGIYVTGALNTVIEGCDVEGEVRTTDDILAEEGTGSPADNVDFMTQWGYRVPPGFVTSLQGSGIFATNTGTSHVTGEERPTENIRVIDSTIKNMSYGVSIGFVNGVKYVENCTVMGCTVGFTIGSDGQIVNSRGDAVNGPLYVNNYQSENNNTVDLTVLNNDAVYGNDTLAYIGGSDQTIEFNSSEPPPAELMVIKVSGLRGGLRHQSEIVNPTYDDFTSDEIDIYNLTEYPLVLEVKSANCTGQSGGPITDNGTNNAIESVDIK